MSSTKHPVLALALLALASPLASGAQDEPVELRFDAEPGLQLAKVVLVQHELSLVEMGTTREGGPLMSEDVGGWLKAGTRQAFIDEYLEVADGRPQVFRRTLENFEGNARMTMTGSRGISTTARHVSPLAGLPVLHTWVPEEDTWGRCFDHLVAEERQLEELDDDADFLGLLPPGPVAVGDSWSVEAGALRSLLAPGGNTGAVPEEPGFFPRMVEVGIGGDLADVLGEDLGGTVSVTLAELREEEGRQLAVLQGEFSLVSERDRTRTYVTGMPKEERRELADLRGVTVSWLADGTFELLWDLEAGHAAGASADAQETIIAEIFKRALAEGGVRIEVSQRSTYSGRMTVDFKVRPPREGQIEEMTSAAETGGVVEKPPRKGKKQR